MTTLPNGCWCSPITVFPANWETKRADITLKWRITYRFYDPERCEAVSGNIKPKQVVIKANAAKTLKERQATIKSLVEQETLLLKQGFNPWVNRITADAGVYFDENLSFSKALYCALGGLKIEPRTKKDIEFVLKRIISSAAKLGFDFLPVKQIKKKHLRMVLDGCAGLSARFTANTFNNYRKYLSLLYRELCELEIVDGNPVKDIAKQKVIRKQRQILSESEAIRVNDFLQTKHYNFWRFVQIFFASGTRISEIMLLKRKQVFLSDGFFVITIKKGKSQHETKKPINNATAQLWAQVCDAAKPNDFLFSESLQPGPVAINPNQITRRWKRLVKDKLGIEADFYSLKHLYTTRLTELRDEATAAKLNGHTSTAMVVKIYDVNRQSRELETLRNIDVPFIASQ